MKLPLLQLGMATLLVALTQSAAHAQYNQYYPANVQGYYPAYAGGVYGYNGYSPYNLPAYSTGGATINPDGSMNNNGVSWNGADPTGGATGIRGTAAGSAAYANPAAGGASGLLPPQPRRVFINNALRQPVYHLYRPRAFTYHD